MKVSMLYDIIRWEEKALYEASKKRNIDMKMLDVKEEIFDTSDGRAERFGDISLQRCVGHYRNLHTTAFVEGQGVKVVNDLRSSELTGNKLFTILALKKAGVPVPRTIVSFSQEKAYQSFRELGNKAVIKPVTGSWGRMIGLLESDSAARAVLEDREYMYPLYQVYYMQEYVKRPPRDIRAFVAGDRVIAAIYRLQPPDDWRTNTARGGKAINCPITNELEDIALRATSTVGDGIFGVDLMESEAGMVVHEINGTTEFKNSVPATGIDIPGLMLDYIIERHGRS
ncbi:MAG: lysine biosynthesis protein LysX [Nitrososphaerota archaeon]|jgi:[lysine-biosynthesis-protein LysW]--L-2-aminoadipate ligase|nr:lysine biosynthesis protein LysX [Nitrososphaerota archaeon]MDG7035175.1 lysine biosynthesis protein LysX [Nitrososphaerota archaeon]MDG7035925.1 lysine biosynthesis protein LysX [Nitrososphaerota archaeon]MDG7038899.1 lysine biosynthesis protein LysX [Nitrososphaerota archaeon]MDG7039704.1 lysine biosynthesis protein LysX [Nitrososphaerota archaeon]